MATELDRIVEGDHTVGQAGCLSGGGHAGRPGGFVFVACVLIGLAGLGIRATRGAGVPRTQAAPAALAGRLELATHHGGWTGPIAAEGDRVYRVVGGNVEAWRFDDRDRSPVFLGEAGDMGLEIRALAVDSERVLISAGPRFGSGELLQWDARNADLGRIDWRIRTTMFSTASGIAIADQHAWVAGGQDFLALYELHGSLEPELVATGADVMPSSLTRFDDAMLAVDDRGRVTPEPTANPSEAYHEVVRFPRPNEVRQQSIELEASAPIEGKRWFSSVAYLAADEQERRGVVAWEGQTKIDALRVKADGGLELEPLASLVEPTAGGAAMNGSWAWLGTEQGTLLGLDLATAGALSSTLALPLRSLNDVAFARAERLWVSSEAGRTVAVDVSRPRSPRVVGRLLSDSFHGVAASMDATWALLDDRLAPLDEAGMPQETEAIELPTAVGEPRALHADGTWLFVDALQGIFPLDLGAARPSLGEPLSGKGHAAFESSLRAAGSGFVAAAADGLLFVWPSTDPRPEREASLAVPADPAVAFFAAGTDLWLARNAGTSLQRIDLGNPAAPRLAERTPPLSTAAIVAGDVSGNLGVVGDRLGRLLTVDLTDPRAASVLGSLDMGTQVTHVAIDGTQAWVVWLEGREARLSLVDLSVPSLPDEIAVASLAGEPEALLPRDARALVLRDGGLEIWRADVPAASTPTPQGTPGPTSEARTALWLPRVVRE